MKGREVPRALYTPQVGELVRDQKHGVNGIYMGAGYGKHPTVYLRPEGGGYEWETPTSEIEPIITASMLEPIRKVQVLSRRGEVSARVGGTIQRSPCRSSGEGHWNGSSAPITVKRTPVDRGRHVRSIRSTALIGGELSTTSDLRPVAPWGMGRMEPLRNGVPSQWQYAGLDPETQTGLWVGDEGQLTPAELGKHGTSVGTYPPTSIGKDGKNDPDTGHDATQD